MSGRVRSATTGSKRKVRIGLIGCGSRLSGVIALARSMEKRIQVAALCDPSPTAIRQCKDRCGCSKVKLYEDYRELVMDPDLEWVCIGSWNAQHRKHIEAALKAGKHVFSEKPLTTRLADCVALQKAIARSDSLFSMGFVLRYAPFYRRVRELIDRGLLGRLVSFEFNETLGFNHGGYIMSDWRRLRKYAGTHLLEKCCHDFDLANWMCGSVPVRAASFGGLDFFKPENVRHVERIGKDAEGREAYMTWKKAGIYTREHSLNPFTAEKDIVDNQVVILEYANGVRATFHTNLNTAIQERRMYLCGTEGTLRGDVLTGEIEYKRIGFEPEVMHERTSAGGHGGADGILARSLGDSMVKGTLPAVGLEDGVKSAVACFGVDEALDTGTVCDLRPMWKRVGIEVGGGSA